MYLFYKYTYKCLNNIFNFRKMSWVDTSYKYFKNRISSNFKIFTARYKSEDEIKPMHMHQEMGVIEKIKK